MFYYSLLRICVGNGYYIEVMNGDIMMGKCSMISVVFLLCLIVYFLFSFGFVNGFGYWVNL